MELFRRAISRPASLIASRSYYRCRRTWNGFLPMLSPTATPFLNEDLGSLNLTNSLGRVRTKITRIGNKFAKRQPGGVPYFGFTYFPRPGEVDPPYQPAKLFRVKRLYALAGKPHWDKKTMYQLGLADKQLSKVVILKNTPDICLKLYRVKHLVEITPITFPNGLPKDAHSGFLKENGEYEAYSEIGHARAKNLEEETKTFETARQKELARTTVKERLHRRWFDRWDVNF